MNTGEIQSPFRVNKLFKKKKKKKELHGDVIGRVTGQDYPWDNYP